MYPAPPVLQGAETLIKSAALISMYLMAGHQRVVLAGEFGFGNYGAEADLVVLARRLADETGAEPVVLSASPAETSRMYGMRTFHLLGPRGILAWLTAPHAIVAGGQNFDSVLYARRNGLSIYADLLMLARGLLGKKTQLRAVGIYCVEGVPRLLLRQALRHCGRITARDAPSENMLRSLGCDVAGREPCPARGIAPAASETVEGILAAENVPPGRRLIGFSIRRTNDAAQDAAFISAVAEVADWCVSEHGLHPLFIPSCRHNYKKSEDDALFMRTIITSARSPDEMILIGASLGPEALAGICARTLGVVTSRHHMLALCDAAGKPSAALGIASKMDAYLSETGRQDKTILLGDATARELKERISSWVHSGA